MELHNLKPAKGSTKTRKRIGRGPGSGTGKTAGRGHKGQRSRSGYSRRYGFEGGQMPLVRRIPKRGFTNIFKTSYQLVNLRDLERLFLEGESVDAMGLEAKGLIDNATGLVKILGTGALTKKLSVKASKFSAGAKSGIESAGGSCEVVDS